MESVYWRGMLAESFASVKTTVFVYVPTARLLATEFKLTTTSEAVPGSKAPLAGEALSQGAGLANVQFN